ncbi:unnamed protein product [Durusdinium trenchii]|uniref:Pentatricopeptide repeat-containing protein, chloroplastic n=1 Tax=Durusdinium trenchii TaxID=1381693 RepID=A0ABP0QY37_9DINO
MLFHLFKFRNLDGHLWDELSLLGSVLISLSLGATHSGRLAQSPREHLDSHGRDARCPRGSDGMGEWPERRHRSFSFRPLQGTESSEILVQTDFYQDLASRSYAAEGGPRAWSGLLALLSAAPQMRWRPAETALLRSSTVCVQVGRWERAIGLLQRFWTWTTQAVLDLVTQQQAEASLWQEAILLLGSLQNRGLQTPKHKTYSSWFLGAYGRAGHWPVSLEVFKASSPPKAQELLNQVSYELQRGQSWRDAVQLLANAAKRSVRTFVLAAEKVITTCRRSSMWPAALAVFGAFLSEGASPRHQTCSGVLRACEDGQQWKLAEEIFEQMRPRWWLQPHREAYNPLIGACQSASAWLASLTYLQQMTQEDLPPDLVGYSSTVRALLQSQREDQAMQLLKEMQLQRMDTSEFAPIVVTASLGSSSWGEALELLSRLQRSGNPVDAWLVTAAARDRTAETAPSAASCWQQNLAFLLETLAANQLELDLQALNVACGTTAGFNWQRAHDLLRDSLSESLQSDEATWSSCMGFVKAHAKEKEGGLSKGWIINRLIERERLRAKGQYQEADHQRRLLRTVGVEVDDPKRRWTSSDGRHGPCPRAHHLLVEEGHEVSSVMKRSWITNRLIERERFRRDKKFKEAEELNRFLRSLGIQVDECRRWWSSQDGRAGPRPNANDCIMPEETSCVEWSRAMWMFHQQRGVFQSQLLHRAALHATSREGGCQKGGAQLSVFFLVEHRVALGAQRSQLSVRCLCKASAWTSNPAMLRCKLVGRDSCGPPSSICCNGRT